MGGSRILSVRMNMRFSNLRLDKQIKADCWVELN
jgi:hypothetical protein